MEAQRTRIRVRYSETDQMGVAHHANYLVWMEAARVEFSRACGFNYREMETQDGLFMVVVEATCRYSSPARFDDEVLIDTWIEEAHPRMVRFGYEMRGTDGRKFATAETRHVFCGRDLKPCSLPEKYRARFGLARK